MILASGCGGLSKDKSIHGVYCFKDWVSEAFISYANLNVDNIYLLTLLLTLLYRCSFMLMHPVVSVQLKILSDTISRVFRFLNSGLPCDVICF